MIKVRYKFLDRYYLNINFRYKFLVLDKHLKSSLFRENNSSIDIRWEGKNDRTYIKEVRYYIFGINNLPFK